MTKVCIYGGSFNPIHNGHLYLANYFITQKYTDKFWFMVSPQNPLKKKADLWEDKFRLFITQLAVSENSDISVCDFEFHLPQPTYMAYTLKALQMKYPNYKFSLLVGADNWISFSLWKDYKYILKNYTIYVYPRANFHIPASHHLPNVHFLEAPIINYNSTIIREYLYQGQNINNMVPNRIIPYIQEYIKTHK